MLISMARLARSLRERPPLDPRCSKLAPARVLGRIPPVALVVLRLQAGHVSVRITLIRYLTHTSIGGPSYGHGNPLPSMSLPQVPRIAH